MPSIFPGFTSVDSTSWGLKAVLLIHSWECADAQSQLYAFSYAILYKALSIRSF